MYRAQRESLLDGLVGQDWSPCSYTLQLREGIGTVGQFSAQIYLDLDGFGRGAEILKEIRDEWQSPKAGL